MMFLLFTTNLISSDSTTMRAIKPPEKMKSLFQLRHLEHPVQHQIITFYSQMGPLWVSLVVAKIGKLTNGEFENNWGQIIGKKN